MTKATEHPVYREVSGQSFGPLVVGVTEHEVTLRSKGRRGTSEVTLPWGLIYQWAVEVEVERHRPPRKVKVRRGLLR